MVKLATRHTPLVPDFDLHLFGQGRHLHAHRWLGAHVDTVDGAAGVRFAVWAPRAQRVSVVGDFNRWDPARHPMLKREVGVWEIFVPGLAAGALYKYAVSRDGNTVMKADPYGRQFEFRPRSASVVAPRTRHMWQDGEWMAERARRDWLHAPLAAYEVHAGSWQRGPDGAFLGYRELARTLVPYAAEMGFTHLELMPVSEHPFDASWGYQTVGYFAPTSRHGTADDLRGFIDECHRHGLGVILDWTPAHFPADEHGLARFDGEALYEHPDPKQGWHPDWQSMVFDYGRAEVRAFLLSNALYWLEEFHFDGLRVDAVASMLYLDYSRKPGEWTPNRYGGHENLEAIDFLRQLNVAAHKAAPGALIIAEESTAWPQVTRPTYVGGLGFSMKWNMGWMHDTLDYFRQDPIHRKYHHDRLTFGQLYAYSENFVLPLSHDEVVHGKGSLIRKMPGDDWQRFANLRLLLSWQWTTPGKKLLFMGQEFAQEREWNHDVALDWALRDQPRHEGVRRLLCDLNRLYRDLPALHRHDFEPQGFEWIDCHDSAQSVLSFLRRSGDDVVAVVLNFTPVPRENYRIGVPVGGPWREILNSDSSHYGGSNLGNAGVVTAARKPWMGRTYSMSLTLPPLGALLLRPAS